MPAAASSPFLAPDQEWITVYIVAASEYLQIIQAIHSLSRALTKLQLVQVIGASEHVFS